jgi:hypothetical protein
MEKLTPKESKYLEKLLIPPSKKKAEEDYSYIKWCLLAIALAAMGNFLGLEDLGERFLR